MHLRFTFVRVLALLTLLLWVPTGVFGADHEAASAGHSSSWQSGVPELSAAGECPGADLLTGPHDHHVGVIASEQASCPAPVCQPAEPVFVVCPPQFSEAPRIVVHFLRMRPPALRPGSVALRV